MTIERSKDRGFMLPAFGAVLVEFEAAFQFHLMNFVGRNGVLGSIQKHRIHEGQGSSLHRGDGSSDVMEMQTSSSTFDLPLAESLTLDMEGIFKAIQKIADDFARQQTEMVFRKIDKTVEKTGFTVDGRGQPLSPELILQALEKMHVDFDAHGEIDGVVISIPESMAGRAEAIIEKAENSPGLKLAFDELKKKKYEQFRDREMDRTLGG
jgi:hypothetical protein